MNSGTNGAERRGHIPALDGIRGLAVLMVLIVHFGIVFHLSAHGPRGVRYAEVLESFTALGQYGVDLFFALSGFLITGILMDSKGSDSYFSTFYLRRTVRIFPLYFCYLFLVLVVLRSIYVMHLKTDPWQSVNPWWYLTYLSNWKPGHGMKDLCLGHMWTLAIEEQFYLAWPLVVFLCPRRRLGAACVAVMAAALALRVAMVRLGFHLEAVNRLTLPRLDSLASGGWVAAVVRGGREGPAVRKLMGILTPAAVAGLVAAYWADAAYPALYLFQTAGKSCMAMACALLVYWAAQPGGAASKAFDNPLLRILGKYSYGIYIFHILVEYIIDRYLAYRMFRLAIPAWQMIVVNCCYMLLEALASFGVAWLSWRLLESPFLKLKGRFTYRPARAARPSPAVVSAGASLP